MQPVNDAPLPAALVQQHEQVAALCRRFGVDRLEIFGSAAEGRFDPGRSDYDFIARFSPTATAEVGSLGRRFVGLAEGLEAALGARVDLLSDAPIRNPYFRRAVDASRRVVYECAPEQASA
jgi:predicted nucleotidyltransferase